MVRRWRRRRKTQNRTKRPLFDSSDLPLPEYLNEIPKYFAEHHKSTQNRERKKVFDLPLRPSDRSQSLTKAFSLPFTIFYTIWSLQNCLGRNKSWKTKNAKKKGSCVFVFRLAVSPLGRCVWGFGFCKCLRFGDRPFEGFFWGSEKVDLWLEFGRVFVDGHGVQGWGSSSDGTHLKGKYNGILFITIAMDGSDQIFPIAFGVGDIENDLC